MKNNKLKLSVIISVVAVVLIALCVFFYTHRELNKNQYNTDKYITESANQESTDTAQSNSNFSESNNITNEVSSKISIDTAEEIALENSEIVQKNIIFSSVHQERNKNTTYYEVVFSDSLYEYEYEINLNGNIISYEKEPFESKNHSDGIITPTEDYIGIINAKNTALTDSSLSAQELDYTKVTLSKNNEFFIYKVELKTTAVKYEYEIDAVTGKITNQVSKPINK